MHIKRLLSGTLAALMVVTSFNVPTNYVYAAAEEEETAVVAAADNEGEETAEEEVAEPENTASTEEEEEVIEPEAPAAETPAVEEATETAPEEEIVEEVIDQPILQSIVAITYDLQSPSGATIKKGGNTITTLEDADTDENGKLTSEQLPELTAEGYSFGGWYTEAACTTQVTTETVFSAAATIYAKWTKLATIGDGLTFTSNLENDQYQYTCKTLETEGGKPVFTIKNGNDLVIPSSVTFRRCNDNTITTLAAADAVKATDGKWGAALTEASDYLTVGFYRASITIAATSGIKGETYNYVFEVTPANFNSNIFAISNTTMEGKKHILKYNTDPIGTKPAGTVAQAVEPGITFNTGTTALAADTGNVFENPADYTVTYTNNKAVGTATVTITLTDSDNAKNFGKAGDAISKTFEIVECTTHTLADDGWSVGKKAKVSDSESVAGTKTQKCSVCNKLITEEIPAVDKSSVKIKGDKTEEAFADLGINGVYDTEGNPLTLNIDYTIKRTINEDNKGVITIQMRGDDYEGSFSLDPISFATCTEHDYETKITPATFNAEGSVEEVCKNCGDVKSTKVIRKLKDSDVNFKINNSVGDSVSWTGAGQEISFYGKAVTIDSIVIGKADSVTATELSGSATYAGEKAGNANAGKFLSTTTLVVDGKDTTVAPFTVSYKNNKQVGTCSVTITFNDKIPEYAGASVTKTFKLVEKAEAPAAPSIKINGEAFNPSDVYHYGDKITLSSTEGAKIYYTVSTSGALEQAVVKDDDDGKLWIKSKKVKEYNNSITLTTDMTHTDNSASTEIDVVKLNVVAEKNGALGYATPTDATDPSTIPEVEIKVKSATKDFGEVNVGHADTTENDATKLPEGLWISNETLKWIGDDTDRNAKGEWSYSGTPIQYTGTAYYTGLPKTLPTGKKSTGEQYTADYRVFYHNKLLTYGTDYTLSYKNNTNAWLKSDSNYDAAKAPTITINGKGEYKGAVDQTFEIQPVALYAAYPNLAVSNYDNAAYTSADYELAENGKIQTPKVALAWSIRAKGVYKTVNLTENTDFTVDYSGVKAAANGDDAPYYPIDITAKAGGNYSGTLHRALKVVSAGRLIDKATVTLDTSGVVFDGNDQKNNIKATVKLGDVQLVQDKDFTIRAYWTSYPVANDKTDTGYTATSDDYFDSNEAKYHANEVFTAGKYTIYIYGTGDYSGSVVKRNVNITNKNQANISAASVTLPDDVEVKLDATPKFVYADGKVTVTESGKILTEGQDYLLLYKNNLKAGTAKLNVIGIGKYTGTKVVDIKIPQVQLTKANLEFTDYNTKVYDGTTGTPTLKVFVTVDGNQKKYLTLGKDYKVTWPKDVTNVGTKTVKVTGMNNYKGSASITYEIKKYNISKLTGTDNADGYHIGLVIDSKNDGAVNKSYTGAKEMPVLDVPKPASFATTKDELAWNNANFSFNYKNGFKAGSTVTVKVTGKKNFEGSVTGTYTIEAANIANNTDVTITDVQAGKKFTAPKVEVFLKDTTKKLAIKKDYTIEYLYNQTVGTHKRYDAVDTKEAMVAGTEYIARINGAGGYKGYRDVIFRVVDKTLDISKATVKVQGTYIFNEQPIELENDDIIVTIGGVAVPSANFQIVGYKNNDKVGKATVKIHGIEANGKKYGGYKEVKFDIQKRSMNYVVTFKADKVATDNAVLTITGSMSNMSKKDTNKFVLPKNGFKASTGTGKNKVNYVLAYYTDEKGNQLQPGQTYTAGESGGTLKTITAKFEKETTTKYTIQFNAGTQADNKDKTMKPMTMSRGETKALTSNIYKKAGYKFVGWGTTAPTTLDGTGVVYANGAKVCNLAASGTVNLYPVFAPADFKITYDLKGGNNAAANVKEYTLNNYKSITFTAPSRDGYEFAGWTDGTAKATPNKAYKIPDAKAGKDIKLTANWTANPYTLKYDVNGAKGATAPKSQSETVGAATKLADKITTTDAELTFAGWAKDAKAAKPDYKAKATVKDIVADKNGTVTLYAIWTEKQYPVKFDLNGGTATSAGVTKFTLSNAKNITTASGFPQNVTKLGYGAVTWKIGTTTVTDLSSITKAPGKNEVVTVTADWGEALTTDCSITYSSGDAGFAPDSETIKIGKTVTLPTIDWKKTTQHTEASHNFSGWDADNDGNADYSAGATVVVEGNMSLAGVWAAKSYAISYDLGGGSFVTDANIARTHHVGTATDLTTTIDNVVAPNGYSFSKFYLEGDDTKAAVTSVPADTAKAVKYIAVYDGYTSTVSYDTTGATVTGTAPAAFTWKTGADATVNTTTALDTNKKADGTDNLTKAGYEFKGWQIKTVGGSITATINGKKAGDQVTFEDIKPDNASKAIVLEPIWKGITYSVVYDYDGGALATGQSNLTTFTRGVTTDENSQAIDFTLKYPTKVSHTTPTKYVVTDSKGDPASTPVYTTTGNINDDDAILPASGTTIYLKAVYGVEKAKTKVVFDKNKPAGASSSVSVGGTIADVTLYDGETLTLPTSGYTLTGYTFEGWSETADGALKDPQTYLATDSSQTKTFYAKWHANVHKVYFMKNAQDATYNGGGNGLVTVTNDADTAISVPGITRNGYTIEKWNTARNGSGTSYTEAQLKNKNFAPVSSGDTMTYLYAQWKENAHATITYNANGGTGTIAPLKVYTGVAGTVSDGTGFTRPGYTLTKWNTSASPEDETGDVAKGATYNYNAAATNPVEPTAVTLYAQWTANTNNKINLKLNGGVLAGTLSTAWPTESDVATKTFTTKSGEITLPKVTTGTDAVEEITKTGYTFGGWYEVSDNYVIDEDDTPVTKVADGTNGTKYFAALWIPTEYTITFQDTDGNTITTWAANYTAPSKYTVESTDITLPVKAKLNSTLTTAAGAHAISWHKVTNNVATDEATATIDCSATTGNLVFKLKIATD